MKVKVKNTKQLGHIAKHVRKDQKLDQSVAGMLSENGLTFVSNFENGKETAEIGRVFRLLEQLGIEVEVSVPPGLSNKAIDNILSMEN